jgi:hypothetical protein
MANHFTLTTILQNGTWGSVAKPLIKEGPEYTDQELDLARRVIRVARLTKKYSDETNGENIKMANFEIQIRSKTKTIGDIDSIVDQVRTILAAQTSLNQCIVAEQEDMAMRYQYGVKLAIITDEIDRRA